MNDFLLPTFYFDFHFGKAPANNKHPRPQHCYCFIRSWPIKSLIDKQLSTFYFLLWFSFWESANQCFSSWEWVDIRTAIVYQVDLSNPWSINIFLLSTFYFGFHFGKVLTNVSVLGRVDIRTAIVYQVDLSNPWSINNFLLPTFYFDFHFGKAPTNVSVLGRVDIRTAIVSSEVDLSITLIDKQFSTFYFLLWFSFWESANQSFSSWESGHQDRHPTYPNTAHTWVCVKENRA
jgi:hypothetical protein